MNIRRGNDGEGVAGVKCSSCHQDLADATSGILRYAGVDLAYLATTGYIFIITPTKLSTETSISAISHQSILPVVGRTKNSRSINETSLANTNVDTCKKGRS